VSAPPVYAAPAPISPETVTYSLAPPIAPAPITPQVVYVPVSPPSYGYVIPGEIYGVGGHFWRRGWEGFDPRRFAPIVRPPPSGFMRPFIWGRGVPGGFPMGRMGAMPMRLGRH